MKLDVYSPLPPLKDAIAGSEFEEYLECLERVFENNNIRTLNDLENSPRYLTCTVCQSCSTNRLIIHIRQYMENAPLEALKDAIEKPKPKKRSTKKKAKKSVEEVSEEPVEEVKETEGTEEDDEVSGAVLGSASVEKEN